MGAVYRATDTKLNRDVAIKVLPEAFASDPDRLARFTREAQVLAALNHQNIAHVYGVEERALIMELVEGNAPSGPLSSEEALRLIQQLIDGLEYAHDRGIVHRDLKPANLTITPDGQLKILDFGLAKALSTETTRSPDAANSPTMTMRATQLGMIIGTAAYMSPEQARGQAVDKRADIWSFGVVAYELLTGKQLFNGETVSDTIAAVLTRDPDLNDVPSRFRKLLRLCLMRDPKQRLRDISGARLLLEEPEIAATPATPSRPWGWIAAVALAGALVAVLAIPKGVSTVGLRPLMRFEVEEPPGRGVISPDGSRIVFLRQAGQIMVRRLDESDARPLAGAEAANEFAISPDGQWVAFVSSGAGPRKVPITGGSPVKIADGNGGGIGMSWADDANLYLPTSARSTIARVPVSGGKPEPVTSFDSSRGEVTHRAPFVLPGSKILLFTAAAHGGNYDDADIVAQNLETRQRAVLYHGGFAPRYVLGPSGQGYVLFARANTLLALPFDPDKMQVREPAVPVLEDVVTGRGAGGSSFSLSNTGVAAYRPGANSDLSTIGWLDASGRIEPLPFPPALYSQVHLSPEGKRILFRVAGADGAEFWIYDLETRNRSRLTSSKQATEAIWARDGRHILYEDADQTLHWIRADGSSQQRPLNLVGSPSGFTPDGRGLLTGTQEGITLIPFDDAAPDEPHLGSPRVLLPDRGRLTSGSGAAFSPDGRWLAYSSSESGRPEIYVRPFPNLDRKWQISQDGGTNPQWTARGDLFFRSGGVVMAVSNSVQGNEFRHGAPRRWYEGRLGPGNNGPTFSVLPDGSRIVAQLPLENPDKDTRPTVVFLVNFPDEVERKVKAATK